MSSLNFITKSALISPDRVVEPLWWVGHIPFVMWLVENTKPQTLVELGTHTGNSYFAMCHSVKSNRLPTRCYAVDTWQGDLHQGAYDDDVYRSVKQHNDINFSEFSTLLRMTFDEALPKFGEGTVDLLHIDGLHTYAAARHDFETWLPKLSNHAVVLFHDTTVRKLDFGVWRLWEELSAKYPNVHFDYSQGLGVLFVGKRQPLVIHDLLKSWVSPEGQSVVHQLFARLGQSVEFEYMIVNLNQAVAERDSQITYHQQREKVFQGLIVETEALRLSNQQREKVLQELIVELRNEIKAFRLSTSWRITQPLREVSQWGRQFVRLVRNYQKYRQIYPGVSGVRRLLSRCVDAIREGGFKGLRNKVSLHERIIDIVPMSAEAVAQQCNARRIELFRTYLAKALVLNPTIIFDHNGGGGSNTYTHELVEIIHADGGTVLRVYCFEAVWFLQWIGDGDEMFFYTSSIEELFEVLSVSRSASIVLNSLYGYPDIKVAVSKIVGLARALSATLDLKIHDFYALCPSPHLSDFEGKYCGVPQNLGVCRPCLKQNLGWYHSWYPKENRPMDIAEWRKPFAELFEAATTVTFFDQSSVEIMRKVFYLEGSKVKIIPHVKKCFKYDNRMDVTGLLHIGILGTLSNIKGGNVVKALCEHIDEQGLDIPITVVGPSLIDTPPRINVHGNYTTNDLPIIVSKQGINVILMPSIVPETFSYTISEAMEMGLPIVAFNIGAQGNRVKQYELGKVVPLGSSPKVILAAIQSVLQAAQQELKK